MYTHDNNDDTILDMAVCKNLLCRLMEDDNDDIYHNHKHNHDYNHNATNNDNNSNDISIHNNDNHICSNDTNKVYLWFNQLFYMCVYIRGIKALCRLLSRKPSERQDNCTQPRISHPDNAG